MRCISQRGLMWGLLILTAGAQSCWARSEKEIRQFLEKTGSWQTDVRDNETKATGTYTYELSFSEDGNSVVFSYRYEGTVDGKPMMHGVTKSVPLRHLDPIHVILDDVTDGQPPKWDIIFRTTWDKAIVKVEEEGQDVPEKRYFLDDSYICFTAPDEKTARRIAKAMSALIKLKGGRGTTKY